MKTESGLTRSKKSRKGEIKQLNIEDEKLIKQKIRNFFINFINLFFMFFMLFIIVLCIIYYRDIVHVFNWVCEFLLGN